MKLVAVISALAVGASAQQAGCSPLHLIYARATTEQPVGVDSATSEQWEIAAAKTWSKGYGAAGYSLYTNLTKVVPGATGYPVHYPASGTTLGDAMSGQPKGQGFTDMMDQLTKKAKECPNMKFALGGHSQGGMLTVGTIPRIPKDILSRVIAVTMFGSYPCPTAVRDRCNSYCNSGDFVCAGSTGAGSGGGAKGVKGSTPKTGSPPPGGVTPGGAATPEKLARRQVIGQGAFNVALKKRQAGPDCANFSPDKIRATGWQATKGPGGHLGYNTDGHYIYAAACFIADKFSKSR